MNAFWPVAHLVR